MDKIERISQYLIEYNVRRKDKTSRDALQQFLCDYSALNHRMEALRSHLECLNDTYDQIKQSAELRGNQDDPRLSAVKKQLKNTEAKLLGTLNTLSERCSIAMDIIDLIEDERIKTLFVFYYIQGKTIAETMDLIHYGRTMTITLHREGLQFLRGLLS